MTPLEYMERRLKKHRLDLEHESARRASPEVLENIRKKIGYYEAAVEGLRKESD